jgi:hypothetical protein
MGRGADPAHFDIGPKIGSLTHRNQLIIEGIGARKPF